MARVIFSLTDAQASALIRLQAGGLRGVGLDPRTLDGLRQRGLATVSYERGEMWDLTPAGKAAASLAEILAKASGTPGVKG